MLYDFVYESEKYQKSMENLTEINKDRESYDPEYIEEVEDEIKYYKAKFEASVRRFEKATYIFRWLNAKELKIPVDVELPIVQHRKTGDIFLDVTVFMNKMEFIDDGEKNECKKLILSWINPSKEDGYTDEGYSIQYVYDFFEDKKFVVNKHILSSISACIMLLSCHLLINKIRNKKYKEVIEHWIKEWKLIIKNSNTGILQALFKGKDIPFYQKNELGEIEEVENGMQLWIEEKEKLPSIEEYLTNRNKKEERIKKASENERNELFNDNNKESEI